MATNNLKHVGQLVNTQRRCIVVFREIPDDSAHCLVVDTDALVDWMHDDVINAVESPGGQASTDFYEYAARVLFTDGTSMLNALHAKRLLQKQPTSNVMMTPNREASVRLDELNKLIREANGDKPPVVETKSDYDLPETKTDAPKTKQESTDTLDDGVIAANFLAQADQYEAEAASLREQAYEMNPDLKPKRGRPAGSKNKNTQTA